MLLTAGVSSGVAPIFVDREGQNRILVVKGANDRLSPADIDAAADVLRTADCVVGGYRVAKGGKGIASLLLGLYDPAGNLHYVGHTSSFRAADRIALRERLRPLEGGESFGGGREPGGPSRWSAGKDMSWVELEPTLERLGERRDLLGGFDQIRRDVDASGQMSALDGFNQKAWDILTSPAARDASCPREWRRLPR